LRDSLFVPAPSVLLIFDMGAVPEIFAAVVQSVAVDVVIEHARNPGQDQVMHE
jgi:hypothetical protein